MGTVADLQGRFEQRHRFCAVWTGFEEGATVMRATCQRDEAPVQAIVGALRKADWTPAQAWREATAQESADGLRMGRAIELARQMVERQRAEFALAARQ